MKELPLLEGHGQEKSMTPEEFISLVNTKVLGVEIKPNNGGLITKVSVFDSHKHVINGVNKYIINIDPNAEDRISAFVQGVFSIREDLSRANEGEGRLSPSKDEGKIKMDKAKENIEKATAAFTAANQNLVLERMLPFAA